MVFVYAKKEMTNELYSLHCRWDEERSCFKTCDILITSEQFYKLWIMNDEGKIFIFSDTTLKGPENKNTSGFVDLDPSLCCLFKRVDYKVLSEKLWELKCEERKLNSIGSLW